jgi:hypothetical protein
VLNYTVVENLLQEVEIPKDGTLSRTLHRDDRVTIGIPSADECAPAAGDFADRY